MPIVLILLALTASVCAATQPNIVILLADDLGPGEIGAFGQKKISTPNLDRMANEGLCFDRAYAGSAVCAPSRGALMTGLHTGRAPIRANKEYPNGQHPMPRNIPTLAKSLKAAGYATGCFGKWGLGHPGSGSEPLDQGFDRFFGYNHQVHAHEYFPKALDSDRSVQTVPLKSGEYAATRITEEGLTWTRAQAKAGKPFFLFLPTTLPHGKLQATPEMLAPFADKYADNPNPNNARLYAAMVTKLDADVGQVMALIRELGIEKNTLFIFCSDNGTEPNYKYGIDYFKGRGGLRGDKRTPFEGGFRTAQIAWWPNTIAAGTRSDVLTASWDFFPTVCELAGASLPRGLSGVSLAPTLTGKGRQVQHTFLFFEFHEAQTWQAIVWADRTKAIRRKINTTNPTPIEIYDLAKDPTESQDIAAERPDLVKKAEQLFKEEHVPNKDFPLPGEPGYADKIEPTRKKGK